jgi:hypothetical protein
VRAIWPALAYRLGPITLGMRRNPYGQSTSANPRHERIAMATDDPRHHGTFGAAWLAGYAAAVIAEDLELLSLNHSHGVQGPLLRADLAASDTPVCVPAWRVQTVLNDARGSAVHAVHGLPSDVCGLAWTPEQGASCLLLANLGESDRQLRLQGRWTARELCQPRSASALRVPGPPLAMGDGATAAQLCVLLLAPYEVVLLQA